MKKVVSFQPVTIVEEDNDDCTPTAGAVTAVSVDFKLKSKVKKLLRQLTSKSLASLGDE